MGGERTGPVYRVGGPQVAWRAAGDEAVVLDLRDSVYFGLNPAGALLWRRLAAGATAAQLAWTLVDECGADGGRAGADVAAFLTDLDRCGLLRTG